MECQLQVGCPLEKIKAAHWHKAALAEGFAHSTFLKTKQAYTRSAFTLGSWHPQMISFKFENVWRELPMLELIQLS